MSSIYRELPCAICGKTKVGPWPTCGDAACVLGNRRRRNAAEVRRHKTALKALGLCPECGGRPKKGYTLCKPCLASRLMLRHKRDEAKAKERMREQAAKRIADAQAKRAARIAAIQARRMELGLEPSRSFEPRVPKDAPQLTEG